jgi:DNA-binding response OmpR family regulator
MLSQRKVSVLLVDNSARVREHVRKGLAGTEFALWEAADYSAGEKFLASPKLAVDILLAEIDSRGWDLAIQVVQHRPQARVLLTSSRYLDTVQSHGLYIRQGIFIRGVEFIAKPFNLDALVVRLREVWAHGPHVRLESASGILGQMGTGSVAGATEA